MTVWRRAMLVELLRLAIDFPSSEELGRRLAVVGERERRIGREQAVLNFEDRQIAEPNGFAVGQFDLGVGPIGLIPADAVAGVADFQGELRRRLADRLRSAWPAW